MQRSNAYQDIRDWKPPRKCASKYDTDEEEEEEDTEGPFDALFDELVGLLDIVEECGSEDKIAQLRTELGKCLQQMRLMLNSNSTSKSKLV